MPSEGCKTWTSREKESMEDLVTGGDVTAILSFPLSPRRRVSECIGFCAAEAGTATSDSPALFYLFQCFPWILTYSAYSAMRFLGEIVDPDLDLDL